MTYETIDYFLCFLYKALSIGKFGILYMSEL